MESQQLDSFEINLDIFIPEITGNNFILIYGKFKYFLSRRFFKSNIMGSKQY
jgi:hypothetical protein